jgi:serine/threonine protein kinase
VKKSLKTKCYFCNTKEGSLEELINEKSQHKTVIEPELQKKWSLQMLNGLGFLHNILKVIHRDVKPG